MTIKEAPESPDPRGHHIPSEGAHDRQLHARVQHRLAQLILEAGVGGRLPTERDLARELDVSRATVRGRLDMLEGLGVIRRQQGSGTFVSKLDPSGLALALNVAFRGAHLSLDDLHSARIALERQAAIEAAQRQDHVMIGHLRAALDTLLSAQSAEELEAADFEFHDTLMRAAGNSALSFFADALSGVLHEALHVRRREMALQLVNDKDVMAHAHSTIVEGILSGDAATAANAVDHHFDTYVELIRPRDPDDG